MAPRNEAVRSYNIHEDLQLPDNSFVDSAPEPIRIVWRNVIILSAFHAGALYALTLLSTAYLSTIIFAVAMFHLSGLGVTAGAHRLWTHRSYQAKLPLRIFLGICNSIAYQTDIIEWTRDHRVHHKYSETNADPHNATRGFFFAHMGWLFVRKHPLVKEKGQKLDLSDLYQDPVCVYQRKFYMLSVALFCFAIPSFVPWYFWGESCSNTFFICVILRYTVALHAAWSVNSIAHLWGNKPYDQHINPAENLLVSFGAMGEGFHNYHHTFPHDYSTSEFRSFFNLTTFFIDAMALLGQVEKRRKVSPEAVARRCARTGDGSMGFGFKGTLKEESHVPRPTYTRFDNNQDKSVSLVE